MPFGLSPTPEEFQRRIDVAPEGPAEQKDIAHDILFFWSRNTDEEVLEDHERNLREVLNSCQRKGIILHADRMQLMQDAEGSYLNGSHSSVRGSWR